ncbi:unnamed protein product [Effrenium voratum]|nr:unnamed protein product [Effrenium voratum]
MKLRYNFRAPPLQRIRRLEIDGAEVDPDREYLIVINSLFHEICADGIQTFHSSPCVLVVQWQLFHMRFFAHLPLTTKKNGALVSCTGSQCERGVYHHDELIRDVVVKYLRWRRHVSGECPHRLTAEE